MRIAISPWAGTMLVSALAAALVAGTGLVLSRHVERIAEKPAGNRVDDAFRETVRRIGVLEKLWQSALEAEAQRMLESGSRDMEPNVVGLVQYSWLNPGFSDPSRAHRKLAVSSNRSLLPVQLLLDLSELLHHCVTMSFHVDE